MLQQPHLDQNDVEIFHFDIICVINCSLEYLIAGIITPDKDIIPGSKT